MSTEHTAGHGRPGPLPGGGWSAVVYGRTHRVDRWWRALPDGATPGGPLGRTVLAVVAGGTRLDAAPRFLLYRGVHGVLVGVACQVPRLGPEMAYDEHGRPLYGFVGWHHPDRAAAHDLPALGELEAAFPRWAGDTYRAWAAPVWDVALERDAVTLPSTAGAAPWAEGARPADSAAALRWPTAHTADVHLLPAAEAHGLWDAALAAGPMADCVLTTGWQRSRDAREPGLTHACCADVTEYRRTPRTPPPAPARAPAPRPVGKPVRKPARDPQRRPRDEGGKSLWALAVEALRSVVDGGRSDDRPAQQRAAPRRPAAAESYLTGGAAYEQPEPPAPGLLGRTREVEAQQASFEGYFGAFGTPGPGSAAEALPPDSGPGAAWAAGDRDAALAPGTGSGPDGARAPGGRGEAAGPGPASGPGAEDGAPGTVSAPGGRAGGRKDGPPAPSGPNGSGGGGAAAVPGPAFGPAGAGAEGPGTVSAPGGGASGGRDGRAGAWGALTADADGPPGPGVRDQDGIGTDTGTDTDPGTDRGTDPDPGDPYRSRPGGPA
ncbi:MULTISPECIES: hypothetical protein [unclassified Streptomyces]|uniref:hypothetical protein n=1 Tax=unclassified Streptomyces TaxID=2593676 RepID=UPI0004CC4C50|nr:MULTISPECIES: hypothetical protein [unclassified Streptomyces]KJY20870.1 hypothetical protein VR43_13590 [Streptomyces sp. NRRL S-104]